MTLASRFRLSLFAAASLSALTALPALAQEDSARPKEQAEASEPLVSYDEYRLENGLRVVTHVDRSDPVVAVALTAHVGSARELERRTGFAHLFEHLLFLESENLGKGGLDKLSARIGGSGANGSTSRDRTNYFQTVPKDALEKMIWAEADKLCCFINTVTEPVLAKEKQVVKNEKRQGVDNQPYGHTQYVIDKALYPDSHPYSWQVIGSLADLDAATLQDVKDFYNRWYTPNNVTLTIAGDFDPEQAREWIEKYFAGIPSGEAVARLEKQPAQLEETARLYYEDNFANLPELTLAWPGVPEYSPDSYALNVLADLLSNGKDAILNEVLVDEEELTAEVNMGAYNSELAGQMQLQVRAFDGKDLDAVKAALDDAFARFEDEGVDPDELERVKTQQEVAFYDSISSVLGKAFQLAQYQIFTDDPGFINQDIANIRAVTAGDVMRVYEAYIKDQPYVATSFVPEGQAELALEDSEPADVVEEEIVQGAEESFDASQQADYKKTEWAFDRAEEPAYGASPTLPAPEIWETRLENGLTVLGIPDDELPLVQFRLEIEGGHYLDPLKEPGVANLLAETMDKGAGDLTTAELEEALGLLGAEVEVSAGDEALYITGRTLARNFDETMELVELIVTEPRWNEEEFELAKNRVLTQIQVGKADPNTLAANAYALVHYGEEHILSRSTLGGEESVGDITQDDVKAFYDANIAPNVSRFLVVGDVSRAEVEGALSGLTEDWESRDVTFPDYERPEPPEKSRVYFYDVPDAKQSVLLFGRPAMLRTDPDYHPATVMNYRLGGGGFASRLTQELREGKGYTYGVGSGFDATNRVGDFTLSSGVRSNVTFEAAELARDIMAEYGDTFTEQDVEVTKSFEMKSAARSFEMPAAKLGILHNIAAYDLPRDYVQREIQAVVALSVEDIQRLAAEYVRPNAMNYVVVGDAATQLERLEQLGYGEPVRLNGRLDALYE